MLHDVVISPHYCAAELAAVDRRMLCHLKMGTFYAIEQEGQLCSCHTGRHVFITVRPKVGKRSMDGSELHLACRF